ncbi:MAG TPA: BtpA/SgcQ family protein [Roseiarcus sp.]|nr:BtpA/SgcQ family protein [Roseiarcus sp.]
MRKLLSLIQAGAKPIIGMVQLGALPGGSRYRGGGIHTIVQAALDEATLLAKHGVDALMVQNLGDLPVGARVSSAQLAWMTRVATEIRSRFDGPLGLNFLENDAEAMLAVASAAGVDFVRIKVYVGAMMTPFGVESGQAFAAIRARNALDAAAVAIFADVHDRTGTPIASGGFAEDIDYATRLGGADGLVLTGKTYAQTLEFLRGARERVRSTPILVGGGVTEKNFAEVAKLADGVIVSSSLKDTSGAFGAFVPAKVESFMNEAKRVRSQT